MVRHFVVFQNVHQVGYFLFELSSPLCLCLLLIDRLFDDVCNLWNFPEFSILQEELNHSILKQYIDSLCSFCLWTNIDTILAFLVKRLHDRFEWGDVKLEVFFLINIVDKVFVYSFYQLLVFLNYLLKKVLIDDLHRHLVVTPCSEVYRIFKQE